MFARPIASFSQRHRYFPHIDGLRALAVLAVVLYHLDVGFVSGGFAGVDVFFVISGYLISAHIRQAVIAGDFSFSRFYLRRIRRLLPALLVTLVAVLFAGYWILPAANYQQLSLESIFALFSGANFLFWSQSGYFDSAASLKPLLHTWSLSVEEQFYLLWPLLMVFLAGKRWALIAIFALALLSLFSAQWLIRSEPALVFFMMPFRITEFAFGACLVWLDRSPWQHGKRAEWASLLGLALIVVSLLVLDNAVLFPGLAALPVCLGTALMIHSGGSSQLGRLLSLPPVVYLGMISYSLYLVHWPLIVFYKYVSLSPLTLLEQGGLFLAALALAILMYHLVETPFRRQRGKFAMSGRTAASAIIALMLTISAAAAHILSKDGWPWRFDYPQLSAETIERGKNQRYSVIQALCVERGWQDCKTPSANLSKNIAILGDSHGIDGLNILAQAFPEYHFTSISQGGCPPLVPEDMSIMGPTWPDREDCVQLNQHRLSPEFLQQHAAIVISVQFDWYQPKHLHNTIAHIHQFSEIPIVVLGNFLHLQQPMADLHNQRVDPRGRPEVVKSFAAYEEQLKQYDDDHYRFLSKRDLFCAGPVLSSCRLYFEGVPFAYDQSHLSLEATQFAAEQLRRANPEGFEVLLVKK
jgi:peptidoglycan/LPS O-acetylase OafA/YrhL